MPPPDGMAAIEYLRHERTPWGVPGRPSWTRAGHVAPPTIEQPSSASPWGVSPGSALPEVHILSNESYSVRLTGRGGGASPLGIGHD